MAALPRKINYCKCVSLCTFVCHTDIIYIVFLREGNQVEGRGWEEGRGKDGVREKRERAFEEERQCLQASKQKECHVIIPKIKMEINSGCL